MATLPALVWGGSRLLWTASFTIVPRFAEADERIRAGDVMSEGGHGELNDLRQNGLVRARGNRSLNPSFKRSPALTSILYILP